MDEVSKSEPVASISEAENVRAAFVVPPTPGETITSEFTRNTYTMGEKIGEGNFGLVFGCVDVWNNNLAVKVLKGHAPYEIIEASAQAEFGKLLLLRHPHITYVFDAFHKEETVYIVTERCYCPLTRLFAEVQDFDGKFWIKAISRCLLQAVHYIHLNEYVHQDIHLNNVFAAFARDEVFEREPGALQFKLGDLGVAKLFSEIDATNTRAQWMLPPEVLDSKEYGPMDKRIDIYHCGLLFLHLLHGTEIRFTTDEILAGRPRQLALQLPPPYNFALEKALRRQCGRPDRKRNGAVARPQFASRSTRIGNTGTDVATDHSGRCGTKRIRA